VLKLKDGVHDVGSESSLLSDSRLRQAIVTFSQKGNYWLNTKTLFLREVTFCVFKGRVMKRELLILSMTLFILAGCTTVISQYEKDCIRGCQQEHSNCTASCEDTSTDKDSNCRVGCDENLRVCCLLCVEESK